MYRKCDRCLSIFKIPSAISNYIINNNNCIYCSFCGSSDSHVHVFKVGEVKQAKRGDLS